MRFYGVPVALCVKDSQQATGDVFHRRGALLAHLNELAQQGRVRTGTIELHIGNKPIVTVSAEDVHRLEDSYTRNSDILCTAILRLATAQPLSDLCPAGAL